MRRDTRQTDPLAPAEGERVRVRGLRRTRTSEARDFARHLRRESTDDERCLWRLLRDRRFAEFKFRRQYPCGIYFLDYFCVAARLAVELDGGGHGFPDQRARDEKRNRFLEEQGIKVLRFWNHQVRRETESVRFEIWYALMERTGRTQEIAHLLPKPGHPSPQSSPLQGERRSSPGAEVHSTTHDDSRTPSLSPAEGERVRVRGQSGTPHPSSAGPRPPHPSPQSSPLRGERKPTWPPLHLTT